MSIANGLARQVKKRSNIFIRLALVYLFRDYKENDVIRVGLAQSIQVETCTAAEKQNI